MKILSAPFGVLRRAGFLACRFAGLSRPMMVRVAGKLPASIGWMARPTLARLAAFLLLATLPALAADKAIRLNLGTLAPRGSTYLQSLQVMKTKWEQAGVKLVIYPDGSQGGEADMIRLMNIGTLHGGLLTGVGLTEIEPRVAGLQSVPMLFRDLAEFDYVSAKLQPFMEKYMEVKGFMVLFWADAGWIRYFSKSPMESPEDLKKMKIFAWAGSPPQISILKKQGYNPVPLETAEILPMLKRNTINAVSCPPIFALAGQLDTDAKYMIELNWAPLLGACVMKKEAWEKIPTETRKALREAADAAGTEIRANARKEADRSVEAMKKRGLQVKSVSPELDATWRAAAEQAYPDIRGTLVPVDIFDKSQHMIKEYRSSIAPK